MLSIIIPIYNGEAYIQRCLDSLLRADADWLEVIAVNDGSQDASLRLLNEYAEKFSSLRVIDKENGGAAQARKTGMELARGEYIGFVDIDDYVDADCYRAMLERATETNADIVLCDYAEVYPDRICSVKNRFDKGQAFPLTPDEGMSYLHRRMAYFPFPWNKIYRADLVKSVTFPAKNFVGEDYNMHLQLFHHGARVEYLEREGYYYVLTESSASRSGFGPGSVRAYEHYTEDFAWIMAHHPDQTKHASHYRMIEYMAIIIAMGRNKTYDKKLIRQIKKFVRKRLLDFLGAGYVSPTMKASAVVLSISYRILIASYRLVNHK